MICRHCRDEIYLVPQHTGPEILVHKKTGVHHCNDDWEVRGGTVAEPKEAEVAKA